MDEANETCNVRGCNAPAVIAVHSTFVSPELQLPGLGVGLPALDYACEKHATKFRVGQRSAYSTTGQVQSSLGSRFGADPLWWSTAFDPSMSGTPRT